MTLIDEIDEYLYKQGGHDIHHPRYHVEAIRLLIEQDKKELIKALNEIEHFNCNEKHCCMKHAIDWAIDMVKDEY